MKNKHTVRVSVLSVALSVLAFASAPATLIGCANTLQPDEEAAKSGQVNLALTASAPSGAVYRLRDGVFQIESLSGGDNRVVSTEEHPEESTIVLDLAEDIYAINLLSGYWLERTSTGSGGETDAGVGGPGDAGVDEFDAGAEYGSSSLRHLRERRQLTPGIKLISGRESNLSAVRRAHSAALNGDELGPVASELVSPNPTLVQLSAGERTDVEFVFRVNGESTGGGDAELGLGISVVEGTSCEPDDFEPNNTPEEATAAEFPISATSCNGDGDFYRFPSPVAAGEAFRVNVEFLHNEGDIDAALANEDQEAVALGGSVTDNETLTAVSDGRDYYLYVYPFSGEAKYSVSVDTEVEVTLSNCCAPSEFPGCTEPAVDACVCELDSFCCEVAFDTICSQIALTECGGECPPGEGDCCEAHGGLGCSDSAVNSCICGVDPGCCANSYDELCVEQARASCGLLCEGPASDSDCCSSGENAGCTDAGIEQCVCDVDPSCCALPFDGNCVDIAVGVCGASCEEG